VSSILLHRTDYPARGEWEGMLFPCVPGYESVGKVSKIGSSVKAYARLLKGDVRYR
jgi:alcohol dehydrogenase (NADP+)